MSELHDRPECFNDAVCVEVPRIFDTCSDRDCIVDLPVVFDDPSLFTTNIINVKTTCVKVANVCITVDELQFKRGFFSVDMTFTFNIVMNGFTQVSQGTPVQITGTARWNKKCILFGSESNIQTFCSNVEENTGDVYDCCNIINLPKATVSVVEPIALDTKITCMCSCNNVLTRGIAITLGMFSIIQLSRPVALLIPTYDYCVPKHECCIGGASGSTETPCEVFDKIDFPLSQFFPKPFEHERDHDHR